MPSKSTLKESLARYPASLSRKQAFTARSSNLVTLDNWYRTELRQALADRREAEDDPYYFRTQELERLMQWKLSRGKWRPRLESLISSNTQTSLQCGTRYDPLDAPLSLDGADEYLNQFCKLKGVGPATASAILATYDPENEPFMSDQALEYVHSRTDEEAKPGNRDYTVKAWAAFRTEMQKRKQEEGWESMEDLEKALWSWGIEKELGRSDEEAETEESESASTTAVKGKRKVDEAETKPAEKKQTKKRKSS